MECWLLLGLSFCLGRNTHRLPVGDYDGMAVSGIRIEYLEPKQGATLRISIVAFDEPAHFDGSPGGAGRSLSDKEVDLLADTIMDLMAKPRTEIGVIPKLANAMLVRLKEKLGGWQ